MDHDDMKSRSLSPSPLTESPTLESALELVVGVAAWIDSWRPACQQFVAEVIVPLANEVEPFFLGLQALARGCVRATAPALVWLGDQLEVVAAAASRLAPVLHQLEPWVGLAELGESHFLCHFFASSHWRNDLRALEDFAVDVLRLRRSRHTAFFVALALTETRWREAPDPVAFLHAKVRESMWRARKTPTADPRSPLFDEAKPRRRDLEALVLTPLDDTNHDTLLPLLETEFRFDLAQVELSPKAKQLLLLRYEFGEVGKMEAARILGWSLTEVERYWKQLERARPRLRRRFLL